MLMHRLGKQAPSLLLAAAFWAAAFWLAVPASATSSGAEIDVQVWDVVSATVAANDIDGMAATYHPEAVLVSPKGTVVIAEQMAKWGEGMDRIRLEGRSASVSFRFASRQDGETTAFESGIFRYAETDAEGVENPVFIPFEALLVRKDESWLILMERQLEPTDEDAWNELNR